MIDRILVAGFGGDCPRLVIQLGDFRLDAVVMLANVRVGHPPLSVGTLLSDVPPMTGPGVPLPIQSLRVLVIVFAPVVLPGAAFLVAMRVLEAFGFPPPLSSDNLNGLKRLRSFEVAEDLKRLGLQPSAMRESLEGVRWDLLSRK